LVLASFWSASGMATCAPETAEYGGIAPAAQQTYTDMHLLPSDAMSPIFQRIACRVSHWSVCWRTTCSSYPSPGSSPGPSPGPATAHYLSHGFFGVGKYFFIGRAVKIPTWYRLLRSSFSAGDSWDRSCPSSLFTPKLNFRRSFKSYQTIYLTRDHWPGLFAGPLPAARGELAEFKLCLPSVCLVFWIW